MKWPVMRSESFPLARALRIAVLANEHTIGSLLRPLERALHPGSRGLYESDEVARLRRGASLPLARALHRLGQTGRNERRVTPARAGSTLFDLVILTGFACHLLAAC
ncbi:hypothetical protein GCM10010446_17160 [Streptomyces enissocaesilis]|uniref:Uncharacterized protein n=1 Tax=Streptomyces enissocaesilis TaxID=332589 RepID=A0ABN3X0N1_9ACTN